MDVGNSELIDKLGSKRSERERRSVAAYFLQPDFWEVSEI